MTGKTDLQSSYKSFHLPECLRQTQGRSALQHPCALQPHIKGREFACGIIDGTARPPIEIIPKTGFFDYANKYQDGATYEVCPADIPEEVAERMKELTVKAFNALKLNVYSRADFLLDAKGNLFCLEMNTLPGMTSASLLPKEAKVYGIEYGDSVQLSLSMLLCRMKRGYKDNQRHQDPAQRGNRVHLLP